MIVKPSIHTERFIRTTPVPVPRGILIRSEPILAPFVTAPTVTPYSLATTRGMRHGLLGAIHLPEKPEPVPEHVLKRLTQTSMRMPVRFGDSVRSSG